MKLTITQMAILGLLLVIACGIFGTATGLAYLFFSTNPLAVSQSLQESQTPPTSTAVENTDEDVAQCILQTFEESEYGGYAKAMLQLGIEANKQILTGVGNPRRVARTEDPKKEVWIIESMFDYDAVNASGRHIQTEVWQEALLDITTGQLMISQENRQAFVALGGDPGKLSLDVKRSCPEIKQES